MAFSLDVEQPVKEEVVKVMEPKNEEKQAVISQAEANVLELTQVDINSLQSRKSITTTIEGFGKDSMERSQSKNKLLETRLIDLSKVGGETGVVVTSLNNLSKEMDALNPGAFNFNKGGLMGKLFNPMKDYFRKYEKADDVIESIMKSLESGKQTLKNDNVTLEIEQNNLRQLSTTIIKQIEMGSQMDSSLEIKISEFKSNGENEDKIKFLEEEVLFPLRQRVMDLQQMLAVNQQGYFAMEVVRKNNKELIRAVDRAQVVTVSALRVAVTVASALANQKLVLNSVNALNATTNNLISSTAKMLNEQGVEIQKQAMETSVSVDTLREAFKQTFDAMDSISEYKQAALPKMKATILEFQELAQEGESRIKRIENGYDVD